MKIQRFALLLLASALLVSGCASLPPQPASPVASAGSGPADWLTVYTNAVLDASNATLAKVSTHLTAVSLANPNLFWRTNADGSVQLKVASFMTYWRATNSYAVGGHTLSSYDMWVTVCPDLDHFCSTNQSEGTNLLFRLDELLGLPPGAPNDTVVDLWVSPDYLFRPTPEPAINTVSAGLSASARAPLISVNARTPAFWPYWYNGNYSTRYSFAKGFNNAYPYTQLGYTYDWDPNNPSHQGLSEFVIPCSVLASALGVTVPVEVESIRKLVPDAP